MKNKVFEERLGVKMEGFQLKPSETVWKEIASRIQKERKKRLMIWWFFSSCIIITGTGIWLSQDYSANVVELSSTDKTASLIPIGPGAKSSSFAEVNKTPTTSIPTSKTSNDNHKNGYTSKNFGIKETDNNYKEYMDVESIFSEHTLQKPIGGMSLKASTRSESMITENLKKRIKDTIIVVNCNTPLSINATLKSSSKNKERQLNFNAFYSFHGSGDLSGGNFEFGTESKFGKRFAFFNNLGISIHSGQEAGFGPRLYPLQLNSTYKSLQTVTAGIQTSPTIYRYSKRGDLKIGAGLVARYQMTSSSMYAARAMGSGTNQYSYNIYEVDPNTFSLGYRINADLLLFETKKNKLGFQLYFQNDTKGDVLTGMGLSFQTKYKK